jgi:1-phosphofructokinase
MPEEKSPPAIVCVALNPSIDRTIQVHHLDLGQHARGRLVCRHPAGKAVNVARVLQQLGQPCVLTGFVGEADRQMFERSFDPAIVRAQFVGVDRPTRECITLADAARGLETHIRDEGSEIPEGDQERLLRQLLALAGPGVWLVFSGSLPPGFAVERFRGLLVAVTERGAEVMLDSSGAALEVVRRVPLRLIKPNREELAALAGREVRTETEIVEAALAVRGAADALLVSAGAGGCYLVEGSGALHGYMAALPRPVTNTVGCGDALLAGFLAARRRGLAAAECLRLAVATATSACFQVHAGAIDAAEIESLARRVTVEPAGG